MNYKTIILEKNGELGILKMNTPHNENRLTDENIEELLAAMDEIKNDGSLRVVILAGEGDFFIRGVDVNCFKGLTATEGAAFCARISKLCREMETMDKVFIAALKNQVFGGGLELALGCDFRIFAKNTIVGLPETALGLIPGSSSMQRLPRLIGTSRALELILAGRILKADVAFELGIANEVTGEDTLMDAAKKLANKILANAPWATVFAKRGVVRGRDMDIEKALLYDNSLFGLCFTTGETDEGLGAYFEGRRPKFKKGLE